MIDYMQRPEELAKHPATVGAFEQMAAGNGQVFNALWSFWNFSQCFDDLIDGSNWDAERKEQAMKALHDFVSDLMLNPFVTQNARSIHCAFVQAMTRCLDGDSMEGSSIAGVRAIAPAVRCGDVDVIMHMAYLHNGWTGLRRFSPLREYDIPKETNV